MTANPITAVSRATTVVRRMSVQAVNVVRGNASILTSIIGPFVTTTSRGVYGFSTRHRSDQTFRVRWRDSAGHRHTGPAIRSY